MFGFSFAKRGRKIVRSLVTLAEIVAKAKAEGKNVDTTSIAFTLGFLAAAASKTSAAGASAATSSPTTKAKPKKPATRVSTLSNALEVATKHIALDLDVDFTTSRLRGTVTLTCVKRDASATQLVLDTNEISVDKVTAEDGSELAFAFGAEHKCFGKALKIDLPKNVNASEFKVTVSYSTAPTGSGIQWISREQTQDKKMPFMFTQCQAIHARTLLPCQDTPVIKPTYSAKITVDKGLVAIMSALGNGDKPEEVGGRLRYSFNQPMGMCSYLIALAVGQLDSKRVGPRSLVWAEPSVVDAAAFEFSETESFLATAESICGPYQWKRYDVLCMPPSFPYGGMENPCLTFVTPTLLAGDRSLADVVVHEITHSWTGNLVTNRGWQHFWLNEGWTIFVQRKIVAKLHGQAVADLSQLTGNNALKQAIEHYGDDHTFTALVPDLLDVDPDDSFSSVPYMKGSAFLQHIQTAVGGPAAFDPFIKVYVKEFGGDRTITSEEFREFVVSYFRRSDHGHHDAVDLEAKVDWDTWLYAPGAPLDWNLDTCDDSLQLLCRKTADSLRAHAREGSPLPDALAEGISKWSTSQLILFLEMLQEPETMAALTVACLGQLDDKLGFTQRRNSEIRFRWQVCCLRAGVAAITPHVVSFLKEQGRMKFVRPLFRELMTGAHASIRADTRVAALKTFEEEKMHYHPIAAKMIKRDLDSAM